MDSITLTLPNGKKEVPVRTKGIEILDSFGADTSKIVALKVDNEVISLCRPLRVSSSVEPVFLDSPSGAEIYRRSLCFVLAAASNKLSMKCAFWWGIHSETPTTIPLTATRLFLRTRWQTLRKR